MIDILIWIAILGFLFGGFVLYAIRMAIARFRDEDFRI